MLTCQQHDYIEIICMYQYPVNIIMTTGEIIQCKAIDTQLNQERQECIKVVCKKSSKLIVLDNIHSIHVEIENPHFSHISFKS